MLASARFGRDDFAAAWYGRSVRVRGDTAGAIDRRHDAGPFDVIGDVHGCREELEALLVELGYAPVEGVWSHPAGRRLIFLGDLVDRGPDVPGVLDIVMAMVAWDTALCVLGNHEAKLAKSLRGRDVKPTNGLAVSLAQLEARTATYREQVVAFIAGLPAHLVLDAGRLVVAHAGLAERFHGDTGRAAWSFALFGDTTGKTDAHGHPERRDWAREYRGAAVVIYGHTPVPRLEWVNHTLNVDTGCVFGGLLTAVRYPERLTVSVRAREKYWASTRYGG